MATKARRDELIARMLPMGPVSLPWIKNLEDGNCPLCGKEVKEEDFRDQISRNEYDISHICQACQDVTFVSGE